MAIKSFQGVRAKAKPAPNPPLLVSDYMTRELIIFSPDQSILEVMELFIRHRISGGPVVDDKGILVGIVSEADFMKQISESRYFNMPILEKQVSNFMSSPVNTIEHDRTILMQLCIFTPIAVVAYRCSTMDVWSVRSAVAILL